MKARTPVYCLLLHLLHPPAPEPASHAPLFFRRDASVIAPGVLSARVPAGKFAVQAGQFHDDTGMSSVSEAHCPCCAVVGIVN